MTEMNLNEKKYRVKENEKSGHKKKKKIKLAFTD